MSPVMDEAHALVKWWAEPNNLVLNDPRAEAAVLRSLDARSGDELEQPYLRSCGPGRTTTLLLDAILEEWRGSRRHCDRCGGAKPRHWLWVACGESVAELACCEHCHASLDKMFTGLVWQ